MAAEPTLFVRRIEQLDKHTLGIEWTDGHCGKWRLAHLRRHCPCATCMDEWTGAPILKPESVDENITAKSVQSVGRYALTIQFSDGHTTGIYSFPLLRKLCQCEKCAG
ncbi:DUF971 domain-containing protein [Candidatus Sumerlaeota bacterium]|nr:DUF971 domain-containing protein [Candidatus Sumerlaeota bacterium]